jgi:hypothetical protein
MKYCMFLLILLFGGHAVHAQSPADSSAVRATALDYIDGWYTADADRMERALHPELAKRIVFTDEASGQSRLDQQGAMTLVQATRAGYGARIPESGRRKDISILDIHENVASLKIVAAGWIDYLHLARWNDEWKIINVLWELTPQAGE